MFIYWQVWAGCVLTCPSVDAQQPKYVALLSGLHIGADDQLDIKNQLLAEFLSGELGSTADEMSSASISRVILAGNSVTKATKEQDKAKGPVRLSMAASAHTCTHTSIEKIRLRCFHLQCLAHAAAGRPAARHVQLH